jgi:hypothetical protein
MQNGSSRRRAPRRAASLAAAALLGSALGFLAALALAAFSQAGLRPPTETRWVVPEGAAEALARGENPLELPPSLDFVEGDLLLVENRDRVAHTIGPFLVGPGSSGRWVLGPSSSGILTCTLHPSRRVRLRVEPRRVDLRALGLLGTGLGAPLGLLGLGLWRYLGRFSR